MVRQIKVAYHPLVIDFLEQLTFELYEKGYFGFYNSACEYVDRMVADISSNIHVKPYKKAPLYFNKSIFICPVPFVLIVDENSYLCSFVDKSFLS